MGVVNQEGTAAIPYGSVERERVPQGPLVVDDPVAELTLLSRVGLLEGLVKHLEGLIEAQGSRLADYEGELMVLRREVLGR